MSRILYAIRNELYPCCYRHLFAQWGRSSHIVWKAFRLEGLPYISVGQITLLATSIQLTAWDHHNGKRFTPSINIGANTVGTHDIPPCSVAVGMPAKVIKQL